MNFPFLLERYRRILKEGGRLEFKTDNRELFPSNSAAILATTGPIILQGLHQSA